MRHTMALDRKHKPEVVEADSGEFSLLLRDGNNLVFSSRKHGLRPLLECVAAYSGRLHNASLTDKVVGRAAARLIVTSGIISRVTAGIISEGALQCLADHPIKVEWGKTVAAILRADGNGICPMEELNNRFPDDGEFLTAISAHFSIQLPQFLSEIPENESLTGSSMDNID